MGVSVHVTFPHGGPTWPRFLAELHSRGESPVIRMIDNLPAFPDEIPDEHWRELRLGFPAGMVTIRRSQEQWSCMVWGTSDEALRRACQLCAEALATCGRGEIVKL